MKNKPITFYVVDQSIVDTLWNERKSLLDACERILFVINKDKDGSYFICEEAKESVENLMKTIYLAKGKEIKGN